MISIIKKLLKKCIALALLSIAIAPSIHALKTITSKRYAQLENRYLSLSKNNKVPKDQAQVFITDLLAENWSMNSIESENMSQWMSEIATKADINVRTLLPDKVEVPNSIKSAVYTVAKNALISGTISLGTSLIITPLTSCDITISALAAAFCYGLIGASIATIIDLQLILKSQHRLPSEERGFINSVIYTVAPSSIAPAIFVSPAVSIPSMITIIPYIGEHLAGAVVPGWAVAISYGLLGGIQANVTKKIEKSERTYQLMDKIKNMFTLWPEGIDINFQESDIYC